MGLYYGDYDLNREKRMNDIIIVHLRFIEPEMDQIDAKYTKMDQFAKFGGNFGIFAEITGISFLGLLNLFIIILKFLCNCIQAY